MLQSMRDKAKSWVTFLVVGIIAFMMAITGLESLAPNPNNPKVASVNGKDITRADLAQAVDQRRRTLLQQMGNQYDPALLDETLLQSSVLDSLIDRQLLLQGAHKQEMGVGAEQLDAMIVAMPQFQQDGNFDKDRFQMLVRSYGMSPLQFRDALSEEVVLEQLRTGIVNTEFVTASELRRLQSLEDQKRDLAWVVLSAAALRNGITPTDDDINAYYEDNSSEFLTPEQVVADYVILSKAKIASGIDVSDDDIEAEYQYRIEQLKQQASNKPKVSVILIQTGENRTLEAAKARANEVIAKLKAGEAFATLAKTYSDDPMTAEKGGDLGTVEPGFFGEAFDNAIASLKVGEVSAPVETAFGVQVLKVTARDKATIPTLESLRPQIETALKQSEVDALFLQQSRKLADISFEASDLTQPAEQFGLTIQTTKPFGRNVTEEGIAADQRVVTAAYSEDVLDLGANSDLIELTPDEALVLRVREHKKPELKPMATVREAIVTALKNERAKEVLKSRSDKMLAELKSGASLKTLAEAQELAVTKSEKTPRSATDIPMQLLQEAFRMPHPGNGVSYDAIELPNGDYAVVAMSAIYPGKVDESSAQFKGLGKLIASTNGRVLFDEYLASLKDQAKVKTLLKSQ